MGQLRFFAPEPERAPPGAAERAYLAGVEGVPWKCSAAWSDRLLVVESPVNESGNFYIPWRVEGHGELVLSTASLMQRDAPYCLPLELARGTLSRLRNVAAEWEAGGLPSPPEASRLEQAARRQFIRAAISQQDPREAAEAAEQAIRLSLDAIQLLGETYGEFALERRRRQHEKLPVLVGAALPPEPPEQEEERTAFTAALPWAVAPTPWSELAPASGQRCWAPPDRRMEWCRQHGRRVCAGPLLRLEPPFLPAGVDPVGDFDRALLQFVEHAGDVVRRYRGDVHLWHVAAGVNRSPSLAMTDEQRLRLAVAAIEAVQQADPQTPLLISFDQPWGEYLATEQADLSALDYADALVRAELGVAGIGLELNLGYWPGGTLPRDLLEINRQLDRWSTLGLPLVVLLTVPSAAGLDPLAESPAEPIETAFPGGLSPESQRAVVARLLPLLLGKPYVEGLLWSQWSDQRPHRFAHGGLLDAQGRPKPVLELLQRI